MILHIKNNINNMNLNKWEKLFAMNYYDKKKNFFPSNNKKETIQQDIKKELDKLYNIKIEEFIINPNSKEILKYNKNKDNNRKEETNKKIAKEISLNLFKQYYKIVNVIKKESYPDAFKVLILRETLTKIYKIENNNIITKRRDNHKDIEEHMILNKMILDIIYNNLNSYTSFKKLYFYAVSKYKEQNLKTSINENTINKGIWLEFKSKINDYKNFIENTQKLISLTYNTNWCTKKIAYMQLSKGNFYIFIDKENKPHIAIKMNGNIIEEVKGIANDNQEIEHQYKDIAIDFLNNNSNIKNAKEYIEIEERNKRIKTYIEKINKNEITEKDIPNILNDYFKITTTTNDMDNTNKLMLQNKLIKIKDIILKYYNYKEEDICFTDYKSNNEPCTYKIIFGNVDFSKTKNINLDKLEYIGGSANFEGSNITNLNSLKYIGENTNFTYSKIKNLNNLEFIGGNADFRCTTVEKIDNLKYVGGCLNISSSNIISLKSLKTIVGDLDAYKTNITNLDSLEYIGIDAFLAESKLESIKNLKFVGDDLTLCNTRIKNLNSLEYLGGNLDIRYSMIEKIDNLVYILGDIEARNSKLQSLKSLKIIGKNANLEHSKITNLNSLEYIYGSLYLSYSVIEYLDSLKYIAKDANFYLSNLISAKNLEYIDGNTNFEYSDIKNLCKYKKRKI